MNRRKAIRNIALITGAGAATAGGFGYFKFFAKPDLSRLEEDKALIDALAETIIPETDTPGAKAAGTGSFIILMLKECTPKTAQNRFLDGLHEVRSYTDSRYGKAFEVCSVAEREAIVAHFEKRDRPMAGTAGKISRRLIGDPFFVTLKRYTILGFCSSQQGATMAMAYDLIPGPYQGCVPLQPGQKCWSTS